MTTPLTTDRIRMFYSTAVAWDASDDPPTPSLRDSQGAEFDRWLAAHDAAREAEVRTQIAGDVAEVKSERDQLLVALNVVTEKLDRVITERDQLKTTVDRVRARRRDRHP